MSSPIDWSYTVRQRGAGRPVVLFLHGFMGSATDWDDITARLEDEFTCLCVDLPGHGRTVVEDDCDHLDMHQAGDALADLARELRIERFSLVGYSMGGRLALHLAVQAPGRVKCLVLESASPGIQDREERAFRRSFDERVAQELETDDFADFLERWYAEPLFESLREDKALLARVIARRLENDPRRLAAAVRALGTGAQTPLWGELRALGMPTLLLVGEKDAKYRRIADEMVALCPAATVQVVPGAGHNVHLERPEDFADRLIRFLNNDTG